MRRTLAVCGAMVVALGLAGCATAVGGGASTGAVVPPSASVPATASPTTGLDDADASAAWLDGGRLIGLVTFGSSSCVPTATDAALGAAGTLTVTLAEPDGPCTKDYAPRVTLVPVPAGVDPAADLDLVLTGAVSGDAELDGLAGLTPGGETDYLPSAGWTGEDDQLVVVTWGSSGCPPVVASVEPTGPASLTVTFETPPADQVCTMDIAPRAFVVTASGLEDDVAAQLTLAGGRDFQTPVTVPVLGTP